ncbi:MAG: metalloprotease TldD [Leptolyngbya sp.]|nr:metalloprotease TldD [Candidatus Melainabacteria bacterium]
MSKPITPSQYLAKSFGLTSNQLERVLGIAIGSRDKGAFADIYFQVGVTEGLVYDQGILKNPSRSDVSGAGVRTVIGDKTGYSYTDHVNVTNLAKAARNAATIAQHTGSVPPIQVGPDRAQHNLYPTAGILIGLPLPEKVDLLIRIDREARKFDPRIKNVTVSLSIQEETVVIVTSLGDLILDRRPLVRLGVSCLAEEGNRRETGSSSGGGRVDFEFFLEDERWKKHALKAAQEAIGLLSAVPAPAGEMTVVLGNGWPGVLIHEAVGHGLEGDFNRKGTSAFSKMMGEKVASPLCTIIDDGTVPGRRGSLNIDDEGVATGNTVLIEKGVLKGYLQDRTNGGLMRSGSTGNGRRESYRHVPMPRMTNTYLAGGESTPEEIIRSVKRGIYAVTFGGGQVDITNGDYTFSATSAILIEDGKLTSAVKGATLIGNGPKSLHNVSMVGNDMALDEGTGTCGKRGQSVPVGVGMPTIRIDGVTVGGTSR